MCGGLGCEGESVELDAGPIAAQPIAATQSQLFHPTADAKVEQSSPSKNYGGLTRLASGTSPVSRSYLRFDLGGLASTVTSARLRLWVNDGTVDGPAVHTSATGWTESGLTWSNQPGPQGSAIADVGAVATGTWLEIDVTSAVTGDGALSLVLTGGSSDGLLVTSGEGSKWPELIVQSTTASGGCGDGSCGADESCASCAADCGACPVGPTATLEADAHVVAGAPNTRYGSATSLTADSDPLTEAYLRFQVAGVGGQAVTRARLRLTVSNATGDAPSIYAAGSSWTESTVTWNTRPARSGPVVADLGAVGTGAIEYDVTSLVTGDGVYTLALVPTSTDGFAASSREGAARPTLVLTTGPAPSCGDGGCGAGETCATCAADCGACPVGAAATLEADAHAVASSPNTRYGAATSLTSDTDPLTEAYLRFRVTGVGASVVTSARLRLSVSNATGDAPTIYGASSSWTESTVTWNTRPARSGGPIADRGAVGTGTTEYDVTAHITGDGVYTLALVPTSTDGFAASSREGATPARLVLTTAPAPVCGDGSCTGGETCQACAADCGDCPPPGESFRFTAVGDHGSSAIASAVLDLAPANGDFLFSLGDLGYGTLMPERQWCDYVKSRVGASYPVQIVSGNHEARASVGHGQIDSYVAADCLPPPTPYTGSYGKQYYVDYPTAAPLARLIAISPDLQFDGDGFHTFTPGSARYQWAVDAIDSARAAGIRWIIVATHRNCITMGVKTCELTSAAFNLLVEKRVDLVLQGHDHNYQRSKQLALGAGCAAITPGSYTAACVTDSGADGQYARGAGTVVVINGTGGDEEYEIRAADAEAPYFAAHMTSAAHGLVRVAVKPDRIDVSFVPTVAGAYSDSFSIVAP